MEVVHDRCAGLDISKRDAKVCIRVAGKGGRGAQQTVTTWGSMTNQVLALREHLIAERVTLAVMEATSDYWKQFYYLLEDAGFELMLVNARHVKNLPGRKTDVSDAAWLAQLGAHGLVRGSFVPPEPIRQLRDLTRTRNKRDRERRLAGRDPRARAWFRPPKWIDPARRWRINHLHPPPRNGNDLTELQARTRAFGCTKRRWF
jgi:transposase